MDPSKVNIQGFRRWAEGKLLQLFSKFGVKQDYNSFSISAYIFYSITCRQFSKKIKMYPRIGGVDQKFKIGKRLQILWYDLKEAKHL